MTKKELIEALAGFDDDVEVYVLGQGGSEDMPVDLDSVELVTLGAFVTHWGRVRGTGETREYVCESARDREKSVTRLRKVILVT